MTKKEQAGNIINEKYEASKASEYFSFIIYSHTDKNDDLTDKKIKKIKGNIQKSEEIYVKNNKIKSRN